jgi:nicotinamide-nucleotide amidase
MFEQGCLPLLREKAPPAVICRRTLRITGPTESGVEELVAPIYSCFTNPATTILAAPGEVQLHLRSFGKDVSEAQAHMGELLPKLETALGEYVFSTDGASLEEIVGRELAARNATIAVAESCTGGLLAQRITSVSGSSAYFAGGITCYSNRWKTEWIGVSPEMLESLGAVSREVAQALAVGVGRRAGSTFGVGITGIAGPTGATPKKPVGLVYVALAGPRGTEVQEKRYFGEREVVRWQATQTALDLVRRALRRPVQ